MIKLTIDNSYSNITGLAASREAELRDLLSYTTGSYFSGFGLQKKSLLTKRGDFPSGLLTRVLSYLNHSDVIYTTDDRRRMPHLEIFKGHDKTAYDWQQQALLAARAYGRGTISAPTGTGKSRVISLIIESFGFKRVLVVVPTLEIKNQLSLILPNFVTVENIDSTRLKALQDFDLLILDECHHAAAKTYHKLNKSVWTKIPYRICLTATPFRNNKEETLLYESIAGRVIYSLDYKEAISKGYIVPIEAYYIEMPKQHTEGHTYREVYDDLVINNEIRNNKIAALLYKLNTQNISSLCLVREIYHGDIISDKTLKPFVSGADQGSRYLIKEFSEGHINILVATTGIMGEGVDSKACEFIIMAGAGKAKSQFMQAVGRAVRKFKDKESAKIILIKDNSHKFLTRHFKEQCAILKEEYGIVPTKLEI